MKIAETILKRVIQLSADVSGTMVIVPISVSNGIELMNVPEPPSKRKPKLNTILDPAQNIMKMPQH